MSITALCNAPSRKIFAPMFRARYQNMQNVVNDTVFYSLIPGAYQTYYQAFIQQWEQWSRGFVNQLHRQDFFSTGMGYTVCDVFTKECMSGSFRLHSKDNKTKDFINRWGENTLDDIFNRMFFHSNAVGNAILCLTPIGTDLYATVYPVNRVVFQIGRRGEITQALILNRFIAGKSTYYTRELRLLHKGKPYWKIEVSEGANVLSPTWTGQGLKAVPLEIRSQWEYCYGKEIEPNRWYEMPKRMRGIGLYNVRNKSVAVALADLPGYSDSTLHTALDVLYSIDYNYTQGQVDQYLGKGRTLIPKQLGRATVNIGQPGTLVDGMTFREALDVQPPQLEETFYTQIPENNLNGDSVKPMFIQPDLRGEQHKYIRDADLELLASKVGLSASTLASHLANGSSGSKTDDEINAENSATEKSVGNKRQLAATAINSMLSDVASFYGYDGNVAIEWGRSAQNSARENQELLADYQAGTLSLRDYLRKRWTDLTEEEIETRVAELEKERRTNSYAADFDDKDYFSEGINDNGKPESADARFAESGNENKDGGA